MKQTYYIVSILFLILNTCTVNTDAQSKFTLFHSSPLLLNPAQTGRYNKDYRLSVSHRREINTQKQIYTQSYFFGDIKLFRNQLLENDFIGIGIAGLNEKSDDDGITNNYLSISSAYHKALNEDGSRLLSLGFQVTFARNNLNKPAFIYEDQLVSWARLGYNNVNPFILPDNLYVNYTDLNAGINFQSKINERNYFGVGVAIQHATAPNKTFQGGEIKVPSETISHLSWETIFSDNKRLYTNFIGSVSEKELKQLITGVDIEFPFNMQKSFFAGCWFRKNPFAGYSVSPSFALKLYDLRFQFAYDINLSQTTTTQSAINFNLLYIAAKSREGYQEKKFIRF